KGQVSTARPWGGRAVLVLPAVGDREDGADAGARVAVDGGVAGLAAADVGPLEVARIGEVEHAGAQRDVPADGRPAEEVGDDERLGTELHRLGSRLRCAGRRAQRELAAPLRRARILQAYHPLIGGDGLERYLL